MSLFAQALSDGPAYMPHGMCYLWRPELLWLHVVSDVLTGLAYFAIPPFLLMFVLRARREIPEGARYLSQRVPHEWMYFAFGVFIVACGSTHFFAAWNVWHADYWLAGGAKAVTAIASLGTAIALPPLIPRALRVVRDARASEVHRQGLAEANLELVRLNRRLEEMDELRTQFFANVSHELRTPLALIVGPLSRRLEEPDLTDDMRDELELVCRNGWLLQKRVDDLLDLARSDAGQAQLRAERRDAAEIVRLTAHRFEGAARVRDQRIEVEIPRSLPAELDGDKFERIVDNLLSNAIKFAPGSGTIRVRLALAGGEIRFDVEDSGPGVPEESRESVFERFRQLDGSTRRSTGGTGLGLSIVREFARLHAGDVTVGRSALGGAHFNVRLPHREPGPGATRSWVSSATVAAEVAALDAPKPASGGARVVTPGAAPRVLVVEDDEAMRRFARRVLESEFECAVADGGEAALILLDRWTPEVVVTDIMMPGMDGFELLRAMRRQPELDDVPVLVLSALADREVRARMLREGAQDYVGKPFAPEELRARVSNLVEMKRARDALRTELNSAGRDVHEMAEELGRRRRALAKALEEVSTARDRADAANEAKTNFLAVMSHELRTPLNAVLGYADLLDLGIEGELNDAQRNQLGRIQSAARHLLRTIEDVLLFARTEPGKRPSFPEPISLRELVDDVFGMVRLEAEAKGLSLVAETHDGDVLADRDRLRHVVTSLVANAVKFTASGRVEVYASVEGERLAVTVADTGPGIAPDHLERIFEPFWQADQTNTRATGGPGLGLSIARRTARQLGGDVEVESRPGEGSRFTFWMPVERGERAA